MFFNGIDQSYCTWYWHGEAGPTSSQPTEMAQRYDTMDCGDVASTVEMVHAIEDEFMTDPMSFKKLLEDAEKPLNLRLAISADGINPHSSMTRPRQPGKDIDVYLAPLVDDLKTLWEVGVKAYDAHQQEFFTLKAILLWTINDFPAYGNLSGCTVKGYYACPICGEETNSHWLKHGNKNSYTRHRRFLPCNHPFRKQKKAFNGEQEFRLPPKELTGDEIFTKDGVKSRLDLLEMGLRPDLAPRFGLKRTYLPPACYTLSRKEKKIVLQTLADLKVPEVHLVREVRLCGPVYMRWMYPFERYMKVLKGYVRNHNRLEGCIVECYIAKEALEFCTEYLSGMDAIGIPSSMKDEWKCGKPLLGGRAITIHDYKLVEQAHHYVLQNTTIVQPFIE
ncbi:hypothetical protein CK203_050425 [Vitis vinifera]|uniref:DUF4218 domain-containing protein n=1 Tax=Vitis vinifera TaxID=29760 RepID=A0A438H2K6_VITVI|nr:hypothetical protein CK203_050425 [Vitis vinifera]